MSVSEITTLAPQLVLTLHEEVPSEKQGNTVFWRQGDFFFNNQKRQATVTDVKFVDNETLVVAHRAAAKLYLIKFKNQTFTVIDTLILDTAKRSLNPRKRFNNQRFFHPDLISLHRNTIYISEYTNRCCVVEIQENKLIYKRVIDMGNTAFHGCYTNETHAMFGSVNDGCITTLSHKKYRLAKIDASLQPGQRIKTIGTENDYVILSIDKLSGVHTKAGATADCWVKLYLRKGDELKVLDTIDNPYGQIDGHTFYKGYHFITMHDGNLASGVILILKIIEEKLSIIKRVACASFPHGLDIVNDQLIYSSYANSAIICHDINELIEI